RGIYIVIPLEGISVFSNGPTSLSAAPTSFSPMQWLWMAYLGVVSIGILRLIVQIGFIVRESVRSPRSVSNGVSYYSSQKLHASSFFGQIFMDRERVDQDTFEHILAHEKVHKIEWHSVDRILAELFVLVNWFNPVAWMIRRSIVENLEYLADSAIVSNGTDPVRYQMSILNQYIGSASITNQFSSEIKNRINMINRNDKMGSGWKLAILFPLIFLALIVISCAKTEDSPGNTPEEAPEALASQPESPADAVQVDILNEPAFFVVEEMPTFNGGDPAIEFRKYIALHVKYPEEAYANGISGKIFIQFVVTKEGKVVIPDEPSMAKILGKPLDEVVVTSYRSMEENGDIPEDRYIQLLKDEVIRVVSSSPEWVAGKQRGQKVNVVFSFPVNFVLQ
ncbi:MAG: M56 family metallopeptidase, partial [Bacteroidales bacterium]